MVLVFGMFLVNTLCAVVPCRRFYDPPVPAAVPPIMPIGLNRQRELPLDFQDALVRTKSGLVQGFIMRTIKGRRIYAFTGVPYGEPPTGQLRYNVSYVI